MNVRFAAIAIVLTAFTALTGIASIQHGFIGIFEAGFRDSASMQVFFDLVISVSLFGIWMLFDARKRGAVVLPYLMAIPVVGVISPLIYLLVREWGDTQPAHA